MTLFNQRAFMTHDLVGGAIQAALAPAQFFVASGSLRFEQHPSRLLRWETFRGHLIPERQTREARPLASWTVRWSGQPLLAIYFDAAAEAILVTRSLLVYGWEPYEEQPNVIATRETQLWQRELVGRIDLKQLHDQASLESELASYLLLALVGTSRLPITSVESPLPAYSLGQIGYLTGRRTPQTAEATTPADMRSNTEPIRDPAVLVDFLHDSAIEPFVRAKLLETALRASAASQIQTLARRLVDRAASVPAASEDLLGLCRIVFNSVALTPYTSFVDDLLSFMWHLVALGYLAPRQSTDLLSYMLRHLVRHLTAFDLEQFHNLGANYPDALALDALLGAYLEQIERHADLFSPADPAADRDARESRVRRRALRQAWLIRLQYRGHLVPDVPTSPGENVRVLPEPFGRAPEEQIQNLSKRSRRIFDYDTTATRLSTAARVVLARGIADLDSNAELRELGMAVYLDRPLGIFKQPGEVDRTPLVSYEAFSRARARLRLALLVASGWLQPGDGDRLSSRLQQLPVAGVPARSYTSAQRPGVVALEDARSASDDFLFLRTTRQSLQALLAAFDLSELERRAPETAAWLSAARNVLLIRNPQPDATSGSLVAFDAAASRPDGTPQPRVEFVLDRPAAPDAGYTERAGIEYPLSGLRVRSIWRETESGREFERFDFRDEEFGLPVILVSRLPDRRLPGPAPRDPRPRPA
jgi:hypothetical protein